MKKVFKTLLAVVIAVIMSFTLFAFTGCGEDDKNDDKNKEQPTTTDKLLSTEYASMGVEGTVGIGDEGDYDISAKLNLNGDADIAVKAIGKGENAGDNFYMNIFMRGWCVYGYDSEEEVTDFTKVELEGYVNIKQALTGILGNTGVELPDNISSMLELDKAVDEALDLVNYLVLSFGEAANATTEANDTITVDVNKLMYNAVSDIKGIVNGLTAETTVGSLLANENLKKYVQIFTELITPEELVSTLLETISGAESEGLPAEATAIFAKVKTLLNTVKPDANSSTYDYIVKLVGSQELVDLINGIFAEMGAPAGTGLTKKLTEFTVGELLAMVGEEAPTLEQIKTMVTQYTSFVTATALTIEDELKLEQLKLVYTYENDYSLKSMAFTGKITIEGMAITPNMTVTFNKTAYESFTALPSSLPVIDDFEIGPDPDAPDIDAPVEVINVEGNTFIFKSAGVSGGDLPAASMLLIEKRFEGSKFVFGEDTVTITMMGQNRELNYVQDEFIVIVFADDLELPEMILELSSDCFFLEEDMGDGMTLMLTYKVSA